MKKVNILFLIENDYYPRDTRVFNECASLNKHTLFRCFVFAPRNNKTKENFIEEVDGVKVFRFPNIESSSIRTVIFEYIISLFWFAFVVPVVAIFYKIQIIHVANPPDFIIPIIFWLKLFGVKFIFDQHDLTIEQFKMRYVSKGIVLNLFIHILKFFERSSIQMSDLIISTNNTIKEFTYRISIKKNVIIVRNSNRIQFDKIEDIPKKKNDFLHLGYIGALGYHPDAGIENLKKIALILKRKKINFKISFIGVGKGIDILKLLIEKHNLSKYFHFYGWIEINTAFNFIVNFDFGILPLTNCSSNNYHTAAKLMDYMCCGVPVCSLKLTEQIITTDKIGLHSENIEDMVEEFLLIYNDQEKYEDLRKRTLTRFNENLCWEIQENILLNGYNELINKKHL